MLCLQLKFINILSQVFSSKDISNVEKKDNPLVKRRRRKKKSETKRKKEGGREGGRKREERRKERKPTFMSKGKFISVFSY